MRKIGIIGYGVLGQHFHKFIGEKENVETLIFDDIAYKSNLSNTFPFNNYINPEFIQLSFFVGLGYKHLQTKSAIIRTLKEKGLSLLSFNHPTAFVNSSASIGGGVLIYPKANVDQNSYLEDGVLIHNSVIISHDSSIGDSTYLSPGVCICGNVRIGRACFIGAGSVVSNGVNIGANSIIGIGSVVTNDLPENSYAIGNPLKILGKKINLI